MTLDPERFRLDALLRDLSVILSASMGEKDIEVLFAVEPGVPEALVGDAMRLTQVLINLSSNAIKFTEKGEVVVSVGLMERNERDVLVAFSVSDTGVGILRHPLKFFENSHEGGKTGSKISGKSSCLLAFMFNFPLKMAAE